MKNTLEQVIDFIHEIDKLKLIKRKTRLFGSDQHENVAEHSWHLAVMALVLADKSNEPVDLFKVIKMLLIHDIVEIDAGDTFLFDSQKDHDNTDEEMVAAKRIFGLLPKEIADDLISIWQEFEAAETAEAKFAKAIDRFEPMLQNASNQGGTWREFDVPYDVIMKKSGIMKNGSEELWDYAEGLVNESQAKGEIGN